MSGGDAASRARLHAQQAAELQEAVGHLRAAEQQVKALLRRALPAGTRVGVWMVTVPAGDVVPGVVVGYPGGVDCLVRVDLGPGPVLKRHSRERFREVPFMDVARLDDTVDDTEPGRHG